MHTRLWALLAELPKLRTLRLQGGHVYPPPFVIHTLEVVELDGVFISSFAGLHQWLSAFPRLASFSPLVFLGRPLLSKDPWHSALSRLVESFNPMMWLRKIPSEMASPPPDRPHFTISVSPTLSSVRLFGMRALLASQRGSTSSSSHGISKNLRRLSLHFNWFNNMIPPGTVFAFVGSLGGSLTHLEIGARLEFTLAKLIAERGDLSFSNCPNLAYIRISDGWGNYINGNSAREFSTWAPHFLSGLRFPCVATICFTMGVYISCPLGWGAMVNQFLSVTMANVCFGNLARVVFELYRNPPPHSWCMDFDAQVDLLCDEIAAEWHGHRKLGIVYEIVLDDDQKKFLDGRCIGWDEKDETGIPLCVRMLRTSRDDQSPRPR